MAVFPTLFYASTCEIPTLLYFSPCSLKKVPLSGGAREYLPIRWLPPFVFHKKIPEWSAFSITKSSKHTKNRLRLQHISYSIILQITLFTKAVWYTHKGRQLMEVLDIPGHGLTKHSLFPCPTYSWYTLEKCI